MRLAKQLLSEIALAGCKRIVPRRHAPSGKPLHSENESLKASATLKEQDMESCWSLVLYQETKWKAPVNPDSGSDGGFRTAL